MDQNLVKFIAFMVGLDALTFVFLPAGAERNPLVNMLGPLAIILRLVAVIVLVVTTKYLAQKKTKLPFQRALLLLCALSGTIGFISNMVVLKGS